MKYQLALELNEQFQLSTYRISTYNRVNELFFKVPIKYYFTLELNDLFQGEATKNGYSDYIYFAVWFRSLMKNIGFTLKVTMGPVISFMKLQRVFSLTLLAARIES